MSWMNLLKSMRLEKLEGDDLMTKKFDVLEIIQWLVAIWIVSIFDPIAGLTLILSSLMHFVGKKCEREYQSFCLIISLIFIVLTAALAFTKLI